jgi:hypothetical protein
MTPNSPSPAPAPQLRTVPAAPGLHPPPTRFLSHVEDATQQFRRIDHFTALVTLHYTRADENFASTPTGIVEDDRDKVDELYEDLDLRHRAAPAADTFAVCPMSHYTHGESISQFRRFTRLAPILHTARKAAKS